MNLDLFNNLFKTTKENNGIQNFINELGEFLENNVSKQDEKSLKINTNDDKMITAIYRDKIKVEKNNILCDYSRKTANKGKLYFVYSRNSQKDEAYNLSVYDNGRNVGIISVKENELPKGIGIDIILRKENEKYILDNQGTSEVQKQLVEMKNKFIEEQNNELKQKREEGHIYEFVEKSDNTVWLIDKTNYTGECFQEIDFPIEYLSTTVKGDTFRYVNGKYNRN